MHIDERREKFAKVLFQSHHSSIVFAIIFTITRNRARCFFRGYDPDPPRLHPRRPHISTTPPPTQPALKTHMLPLTYLWLASPRRSPRPVRQYRRRYHRQRRIPRQRWRHTVPRRHRTFRARQLRTRHIDEIAPGPGPRERNGHVVVDRVLERHTAGSHASRRHHIDWCFWAGARQAGGARCGGDAGRASSALAGHGAAGDCAAGAAFLGDARAADVLAELLGAEVAGEFYRVVVVSGFP